MRVRRATDEDAAALGRGMKVVADEDAGLATQSDATIAGLTAMFRAAIDAGDTLFVLEKDGELAGSLGLHPAGARGVLDLGMWVLPAWRRRGGGRMLVEAALEAPPPTSTRSSSRSFPRTSPRSLCTKRWGSSARGCAATTTAASTAPCAPH